MKTLAVISHKGGAGKTSSAVMLAEDLASRGFRVVLVDADRQRGAGLLLGIEQPGATVMQTQNPRLRYFCSSGLPLRELPARSEELAGLFDVAVVDTPSLDDPLARAWMQLSSAALMLIPIEPVSLKTLEGAEAAFDAVKRLNPGIQLLGILATMFDAEDSQQRTLMLELKSRRPDDLLPVPTPHDPGLAHRAAQKAEQRTEASQASRQAYHAAGEHVVQAMGLGREYGSAPSPGTTSFSRPKTPAAPAPAPSPSSTLPETKKSGGGLPLVGYAIVVLVVALLLLGLSMLLKRPHRSGSLPAAKLAHQPVSTHRPADVSHC